MTDYNVIQIIDLLNAIGEEEVQSVLSEFSCQKNLEIENFIRSNSIDFAKKKQSMTHLIIDNDNGNFVGFFTLTHKPISVKSNTLSKTAVKKILKYAKYDEAIDSYILSAFLIAQLGKNYALNENERIDGNELMTIAYNTLFEVQHQIGGGVMFLECEQNPKLLDFYTNSPNCFRIFGERYSESDGTKYIQLLRFL